MATVLPIAGAISALELIKSALRLVNAIAIGETPTGQEASDALRVLNNLLETWSIESLTVLTREDQTFDFVPGQASYTIGPGGDWDGVRPVQIGSAYTRYQGTDFPILEVTDDWYNLVATKNQQSQIPCWFKYDADYPLGTITLWPVPNVASTVTITANKQFASIPSTATLLVLAPGYERALRYALAVDLAPEFQVLVPQIVADIARGSKAAIKRANSKPMVSRADPALMDGNCYSLGQFLGGNY